MGDPELRITRAPRTWLTYAAPEHLAAALDAIRARGGGEVRWWVTDPVDATDAIARDHGLVLDRDLLQLRRPLPVDEPVPPIALRPFVPGEDEGAWVEVNNRAFASHPEQGGWTVDDVLAREREPWFDADGFLLHEDGAAHRLVGFVWTKVHAEEQPPLGEIYVIAVDPDYGGHGLGRALTMAGLDHLHRARHMDWGMLYVDATNAPAVRMYEGLGFTTHRVDRAYVGRV